jgi:hypothetical protein
MDDEEVTRLANIVSDRVFESMSKFVAVLEDTVRENELLRTKVAHLELLVFGPEGVEDDDDVGDDELVPAYEMDDKSVWESDDSDDDDDDGGGDLLSN